MRWMRWKNNFKAVKKFFSPLPAECSEKLFSALLAECGEKKSQIANLTNVHRQFQRSSQIHRKYHWSRWKMMAQWNKKLFKWRRWEVRTRGRQFAFCKKSGECGEKKIHRKNRKNSPHSTLKDLVASRWKKFFSPLLNANLTLFFNQISTG